MPTGPAPRARSTTSWRDQGRRPTSRRPRRTRAATRRPRRGAARLGRGRRPDLRRLLHRCPRRGQGRPDRPDQGRQRLPHPAGRRRSRRPGQTPACKTSSRLAGVTDAQYRTYVRGDLLQDRLQRLLHEQGDAHLPARARGVADLHRGADRASPCRSSGSRHFLAQPLPGQQDQTTATDAQWAAALARAEAFRVEASKPDADWFELAKDERRHRQRQPGRRPRLVRPRLLAASCRSSRPRSPTLKIGELSQPVKTPVRLSHHRGHRHADDGRRPGERAGDHPARRIPTSSPSWPRSRARTPAPRTKGGDLGWVIPLPVREGAERRDLRADEGQPDQRPGRDRRPASTSSSWSTSSPSCAGCRPTSSTQVRQSGFNRWLTEIRDGATTWIDPAVRRRPDRRMSSRDVATSPGVDRLLAAAGIDPAHGVQVVAGRRAGRRSPFDPSLPLVLLGTPAAGEAARRRCRAPRPPRRARGADRAVSARPRAAAPSRRAIAAARRASTDEELASGDWLVPALAAGRQPRLAARDGGHLGPAARRRRLSVGSQADARQPAAVRARGGVRDGRRHRAAAPGGPRRGAGRPLPADHPPRPAGRRGGHLRPDRCVPDAGRQDHPPPSARLRRRRGQRRRGGAAQLGGDQGRRAPRGRRVASRPSAASRAPCRPWRPAARSRSAPPRWAGTGRRSRASGRRSARSSPSCTRRATIEGDAGAMPASTSSATSSSRPSTWRAG